MTAFFGNALYTLVRFPGALGKFGDFPPEARQVALNELLRFDTPFQAQERAVTVAMTLRGRRIAVGDRVVVLFGAAHRDPEKFSDPDRLDLSRSPNPHFGFGRGTHSCLGARWALIQARVLLTEFATHYPHSTLAGQAIREANPTLRGLVTLPVTLRP